LPATAAFHWICKCGKRNRLTGGRREEGVERIGEEDVQGEAEEEEGRVMVEGGCGNVDR